MRRLEGNINKQSKRTYAKLLLDEEDNSQKEVSDERNITANSKLEACYL